MLNLPNLFSIARILSIPIFIILLISGLGIWALIIYIAAAISDAVDGLLARVLHQRTVFGSYIDPAADKLLTASSYITLAILHLLPGWVTIIVISRDVIIFVGIMILFWTGHKLEIHPLITSKITTVLQLSTVIFALYSKLVFPLPFVMTFFLWATVIATAISGMQYIAQGVKIINKEIR